jgi:hypothetical protein
MALKMNNVLRKYELNVCVFAYVKDERNNLFTMNYALIYILFCEVLGLLPDYQQFLYMLIGNMQCSSGVNMPQMIPKYVLL